MDAKQRLQQIEEMIAADLTRMRDGGDPALTPAQLAELLTEAQRLAAAVAADRPSLTQEEQQQASGVINLWTATLDKMSRDQQLRELHQRRTDGDRIGAYLIGLLTAHADVQALARQPLENARAEVSAVRQEAAAWRAAARQTPAQRQQAAALRQKIEHARNGPPPAPAPDRVVTYGADHPLLVL